MPGHTQKLARQFAFHRYSLRRRYVVSAIIINLEEYRKRKADERSVKRLRGRGFPIDMFFGPDDLPDDFGILALLKEPPDSDGE